MDKITQLYPLPTQEMSLNGAYLAHDLRQYAGDSEGPYIYANFVASIDGRIAISRPGGSGMTVPKATANPRDWRLFQELAAQADIILSSGRYLRDWAEGRAQEILQVEDPRFADLRRWREDHGLPLQADIAIISASLDFPIPPVLTEGGRRVIVVTTHNPDPARVKEIESRGVKVVAAGEEGVDGGQMSQALRQLGYRLVFSAAGPRILHLLITGGVLNRLYLTQANRMLGGTMFASILDGPLLDPPLDLKIYRVYYDSYGLDGLGQMFVSYDHSTGQL